MTFLSRTQVVLTPELIDTFVSYANGQTDVDRVRDATDLLHLIGEHVPLKPKGREHVGLCPFHDDHKPSFYVITHKGNAFYKCHACGAGGDAFDFVKNYHRMEFPEALRYLAERAGITLSRRGQGTGSKEEGVGEGLSRGDLRKANSLAADFFQQVLKSETAGKVGRSILEERGINPEMAEQFMIGLAPKQWEALLNVIRKRQLAESTFHAAGLLKQRSDGSAYDAFRNRLIFPICDQTGQPVAFGARKIAPDDEPKYLNSAESAIFHKSRTLYGLHLAQRSIIESRQAVITEGYTDVISCHQHGLCNVVGTLGTALTSDHAAILSRLCDTVVLLFDGDDAGIRAADRGIEAFFAHPVDVRICALPDGADPDDLLRTDGGVDRMRELLASAQDALEYKVHRFQEVLSKTDGLSARQKLLESFLGELAQLGFTSLQGVRKRLIFSQLADLLAIPTNEIEQAIARLRVPTRTTSPRFEAAEETQGESGLPDPNLSPARGCAEHELLALLLFDPELGTSNISINSELSGCITDLFHPDNFHDAAAKHIADRVFAWIDAKEKFTVQRLLGELPFDDAKRLASKLYFDGERRCGQTKSVTDEIQLSAQALFHCMSRDEYHRSVESFRRSRNSSAGTDRSQDVMRILEERRRQQTIAPAIATGVRS